jgi:hypothetical protein
MMWWLDVEDAAGSVPGHHGEPTHARVLDGQNLRISLGDKQADTFFEASFNDDHSDDVGTWHYASVVGAADERITYTRVE